MPYSVSFAEPSMIMPLPWISWAWAIEPSVSNSPKTLPGESTLPLGTELNDVPIATALNTKLPCPGSAEQWAKDSSWGRLLPGNPLRSSAVLFPRIEPLEKVAT